MQFTQDSTPNSDNEFKINNQYSSLPGNVINTQKSLPSQESLRISLWKEPGFLRKVTHTKTLSHNVPDAEFEDQKLYNVNSQAKVLSTHVV